VRWYDSPCACSLVQQLALCTMLRASRKPTRITKTVATFRKPSARASGSMPAQCSRQATSGRV
jgi:hypothetical protein